MDRDQEPVAVNRTSWRRLAKDLTPPLVVSGARRLARARRNDPAEWEHVPEGWARAGDDLRGWDDPSVLDAYRSKLPALRAALEGPGPLAFSTSAASELGAPNVAEQNAILAFAHALLRATGNSDRVSVLDWGGGLGYFLFVARALVPKTVEIDYHCKELPAICEYGRDALPEITFWDDDACFTRRYGLVVASNALQYSENWRSDLAQLARASTGYLFLTRVPVVFEHTSFVVLQRTRGYRFDTEYLSWVFNERELTHAAAESGMDLVREFLLAGRPHVAGAPEQHETRAYLFRSPTGTVDQIR